MIPDKPYPGPYADIAAQVHAKRAREQHANQLRAIAGVLKQYSERLFSIDEHRLGAAVLDIVEKLRQKAIVLPETRRQK